MKRFALFLCAVFFVALFVACSTDAGDEPEAPAPAATPAPATYTVTFNANGGAGSMQSQTFTRSVEQALRANTFTRTGYAFAGWAKKANAEVKDWSNGESIFIEKNTTLYAVWVEGGAEYTVLHYKQNTALNGYDEPVKETTAGTIGANTEAKAHEYEGFTAKQVTQATIDENGSTEVKIYYERNSCTVTFNANGGEGAMQAQTFVYGVSQTYSLTANTFTRSGYTFAGWATSANGTKTYDDGATYAIGTENVTLYAVWISTDVSLKTLSFNGTAVKVYDSATSRTETEVIKTAGTHEYYIEYQGKELNITAEKNDEKATLTLSSTSVTATDSTEQDVTLTVIAEDGVTKNTYTLHTVRVFTFDDAVTAIKNRTTNVTIKMVGTVKDSSLSRTSANNDTALSTALKSASSKVSLDMSEITGFTKLPSYAFADCLVLESILIPKTVKSIGGNDSFAGCTSLKSVILPQGLESIGGSSFRRCSALLNIELPDSLKYIFGSAFAGCTSLTSITIPSNVSTFNKYIFGGCTALRTVIINSKNIKQFQEELFKGCRSLTSVTIPSSVTSIENYAFQNCTSLTSVDIPDSVTSIGQDAFYGCESLRGISIANNNTAYKDIDGVVYTKDGKCLVVCPCGKTSVTIPNSVTTIWGYAFHGCTSLTSVDIPDSVTSIEGHAFYGCTLLTEVTIGNNVTAIRVEAFRDCTSLERIEIPESVSVIGTGAFSGNPLLREVILPHNLVKLGKFAFAGCTSLTSVTFSVTDGWYYTSNSDFTGGDKFSEEKFTDTSTMAKYLTGSYGSKYWYRE